MDESNIKDVTVKNDQSIKIKRHKDKAIDGDSTKSANKNKIIKPKDDVNKNSSTKPEKFNVKKEVKSENGANEPTKDKDGDENNVKVVYFDTGQGIPEEVRLHEDTIESTEDENINYHNLPHHFDKEVSIKKQVSVKDPSSKISDVESDLKTFSVGNFLKEDGTIEEVRVSLEDLESDSEEDSEVEEEFDEHNIPHHFDEDGSIQKLALPKTSSSKKITDEESDLKTFSVGNFLKEDGTIEEVRISLKDLESDSEEDSEVEEEFDEHNIPHHFDEDGSIQKLVLPKKSSSKKTAQKNGK